jgi:dTDP-4-amino-4,6-dideoxy-D-galactose acyltransferase
MQFNTLESLVWDSHFFGYTVAQIVFDLSGYGELEYLIQDIKNKGIRLTYFFVPPSNQELNKNIVKKGGVLVDQKTIFSKPVQAHSKFKNKIIVFEDTFPNEKLIELGLQAGLFSRFRTDKKFQNKEFERLYTQWLVNSVNKTIAFKTILALYENNIVGLITIGKKNNYADIGLVAVEKNYTGKGIGTDLINFADNLAYEMKFEELKVVTQLQNTRACNLYEKCNFKIESITNVYHFWQ